MADPRFFDRAGPFSLSAIADKCGAQLLNAGDADLIIEDVAALDVAGAGQIGFLDNRKYRDQFIVSKAQACIVHPDMAPSAPAGMALLTSPAPYKTYARVASLFYPQAYPAPFISERAGIHETAQIGAGCVIEDFAVIKAGAIIGNGCWIEAGAVIGSNVVMGAGCRIGSGASVSHTMMGDNVRLYPGVRAGQDGFGFAIDPAGHVKVPQLGRVIIGNNVEIGANTTIDRGAGPDTVIGDGCWIDNLVQIGHNAKLGRGCIIVAQAGVSGSTVLDDFVAIGGQVGIAGHLKIGKGARIAAQSGVMRDISAGEEHMGYPAIPIKQFMRQTAYLARLADKKNT